MAESSQYEQWLASKGDEVQFWDSFFATKGSAYGPDYQNRMNPDQPLDPYHRYFIDRIAENPVLILDVGSGPLTVFGKIHTEKKLDITATDPLAYDYTRIMEKYGVKPPVRSVPSFAEKLTEVFPQNHYDLVYARNCLDHSFDPVEGILQMIRTAKEGGWIVLNHFENVGDNAGYGGLHQWGFTIQDGALYLNGKTMTINLSRELDNLVEMVYLERQGTWIVVHMRKKASATAAAVDQVSERNRMWRSVYRDINTDTFLRHQRIGTLARYLLLRVRSRLDGSNKEEVTLGLPTPPSSN